jgi:hypothetical protein
MQTWWRAESATAFGVEGVFHASERGLWRLTASRKRDPMHPEKSRHKSRVDMKMMTSFEPKIAFRRKLVTFAK